MIKYGLDTDKVYINNKGLDFEVIKFIDCYDIVCKFSRSGYVGHFRAGDIRNGEIRDIMHPNDKGFINDVLGSSNSPHYMTWIGLYNRLSEKLHNRAPTYKDTTICKDWYRFSKFAEWSDTQDYQGKQLDKDILIIGNKHYSPETCIYVDQRVNKLGFSIDESRGSLPIGVSINSGKYRARCSDLNGRSHAIGSYETKKEARKAYYAYKAKLIREIADTQEERVKQGLIRHAVELEKNIK